MGSACNRIWYCMSYKMAAYSLTSDCVISHFSVADLLQTVHVVHWYAAKSGAKFRPAAVCTCGVLVYRKCVATCHPARRSTADWSCGIIVCGKSGANFHPAADLAQTVRVEYSSTACNDWSKVSSCRWYAADCSCGILECGKSTAKFHPAADLQQTVPVAYWYAASLQQNFFLPHTSAYSLPQTKSLPQICGRSAAYLWLSYGLSFDVQSEQTMG